MKVGINRYSIFLFALMIVVSCKQPYEPPAIKSFNNFLVVDGFLSSGGQTTFILSRTRSLADSVPNIPESYAQVTVEGEASDIFPLYEVASGTYTIATLILNNSEKYRLRIITTDGKQYLSDYVEVIQTPAIDSISWEKKDDGVHIYANSHDPQNNAKYYKWNFDETWEYNAPLSSGLQYVNHTIVPRDSASSVYRCWHDQLSTEILIASSEGLSQDVISKSPLVLIPSSTQKLGVRYSINVQQHSLTKEGYEYWQNLKKNTEQLGSIFDAQPSQVTGNIHCTTDPQEPVIGFISASSLDSKRIFIDKTQVEPWQYPVATGCKEFVVLNKDLDMTFADSSIFLPVEIYLVNGLSQGVYGSDADCVDCRKDGGSIVKPIFWQ